MRRIGEKGLTLVELLVAMAMAGIVMVIVYAAYQSQVQTRLAQEAVLNLQENARAALALLENEIRMAGCDPSGSAGAGILTARADYLQFTMDINDDAGTGQPDGDVNDAGEQIEYKLTNDTDDDGIFDDVPCDLGRQTGGTGGFQAVAENVDALNFVYFGEDRDGDGAPDRLAVPVANPADIRSITVTLVLRSHVQKPGFLEKYTDSNVYTNPLGEVVLPAQNDDARRMLVTSTIYCRNIR